MATRIETKPKDLYEEDFYVWTEVQAELLRERQFGSFDLANLIEEVEGLGNAKKSAVLSNASVIIEHLLKLQFSPAADQRSGWIDSVLEPATGSSSTSRRACVRSCRTSWRVSTRSRAVPPSAACEATARMPQPLRCPPLALMTSTRSPATGGRERQRTACCAALDRRVRSDEMATQVKPKPNVLYDEDFYAWSRQQADLLRADRFPELDLDHLIEEVDDLGGALKRSVRSRIGTIIEHLLKLGHSPAHDPRGGGYDTIITQRRDLTDELTPSIRREIEPELARLYDRARMDTATSLRLHGEANAADALPADCPYSFEQITGDWWP